MYTMIWHLKFLNQKTILRPSIVGGMPLKRTHVVPSLNIECTPRVCISSLKIWCFEMRFSQSELFNNISFSGLYSIRCLFNFNIIDASTNPPPSNDLFGVMISFRVPKSHSSPLDPGLDASKAAAASAKQGILGFSI